MLKVSWEASQQSEESVVSYVLSTREKLKEMADIVQENLKKVQDKQKKWYHQDARL